MSVKDVIKNSVYESLGGGTTMNAKTVILILLLACLAGIYIYAIYKLSSRTAFYSKDLNITMAGMPVIVAAIMIAMQSNLLVSLGMVGALSIVRFRNAVKNPGSPLPVLVHQRRHHRGRRPLYAGDRLFPHDDAPPLRSGQTARHEGAGTARAARPAGRDRL